MNAKSTNDRTSTEIALKQVWGNGYALKTQYQPTIQLCFNDDQLEAKQARENNFSNQNL